MTDEPVSPAAAAVVDRLLSRELSPAMAAVHLCMETASPDDLARTLAEAERRFPSDPQLRALSDLLDRHADAWGTIRGVVGTVRHDAAPDGGPAAVVARTAAMFDRAVAISPEASVALLSFGDPGRLRQATAEIVAVLDGLGVLGRSCRVVEIGCGIGRIAAALAPRVGSVRGLDVSPAMVAEASERCRTLVNVIVEPCNGLDLASVPSASADLVLAVDVFPYIVAAGEAAATAMVGEAARVLSPGGSLVIVNWSYGGAEDQEMKAVSLAVRQAGLTLRADRRKPFAEWDGVLYHARKTGPRTGEMQ